MMKRVLLFCLFFPVAFFGTFQGCSAQSDLDAFWESLCAVNQNYAKYRADSSKFKFKCRAEFLQMAREGMRVSKEYDMEPEERQLLAIINGKLVGQRNPLYKLVVLDGEEPNAFVMPDGSVYVYLGLLQMLDAEELFGIVAHEIAHYKLKHAEIAHYAQKKKERRNETWAGILAGVSVAAYGAGQGLAGQNVDQQFMNNLVYTARGVAAENAENWGFKYSRMQELEADMAAANLLDYLGPGRSHLISAFKKLQAVDRLQGVDQAVLSKKKRKKDSHPTWAERIDLLQNYQTFNDYLDPRIRKETEKKKR